MCFHLKVAQQQLAMRHWNHPAWTNDRARKDSLLEISEQEEQYLGWCSCVLRRWHPSTRGTMKAAMGELRIVSQNRIRIEHFRFSRIVSHNQIKACSTIHARQREWHVVRRFSLISIIGWWEAGTVSQRKKNRALVCNNKTKKRAASMAWFLNFMIMKERWSWGGI